MNDEFYVKVNDEEKGPYTFDELTDGRLEPNDEVRTPFKNWKKASDIPDFTEYFRYEGFYFPTEGNLASFGIRFVAFAIDHIVISFMVIIGCFNLDQYLPFRMTDIDINNATQREILQTIFTVVFFVYNFLFYVFLGGTLGQYLCKLIIVDADGKKLSVGKALIRSLCKVLSFNILFLGFISVLFSQYKQAFHDALAKTYVVRKETYQAETEETEEE